MRPHIVAAMCAVWLLTAQNGDGAPRQTRTKSGVEMVLIAAGSFTMGDARGEPDETPHKVRVTAFYMDKYPVTQRQYEKLMGKNPSRWKGRGNPVEQVRWSDAVRYCNERSRREGLRPCYDLKTWKCHFDANGYRLPTEAEWEYACRAGTTGRYSFGDSVGKLKNCAWFKDNAAGRPRPVGQKLPNAWGLHDMHGNVWEWCNDHYAVDYYQRSPEKDPTGPGEGDTRVVRGGCWRSPAEKCRSSHRNNEAPGYSDICFGYDIYGFRAVRRAAK
ncbi:MAG: formylglycine-generating enzyme family protein [Armatimonadota bacterium]